MKPRILLIDDDASTIASLKIILAPRYEVVAAVTAREGLTLFDSHVPDLVILDILLPGEDGLAVLRTLRDRARHIPMIMLTGLTSAKTVVTAMKLGADDYLTKPFDVDELRQMVAKCLARDAMNPRETDPPPAKGVPTAFHGLIGATPVMQELYGKISKVSDACLTVLLTGESGTGKELVARALHQNSARRDCPFVPLNCAAVPDTLIESEFFGHERGAFTDAHTRQAGLFELASGGTLFLDEISELCPRTQAKLLRVLQEREFRRIGGAQSIKVDVWIIAATNRDLKELVGRQHFRDDLYYRLHVAALSVPPLRKRAQDIPLLVHHFLTRTRNGQARGPRRVSREALDLLRYYDWPGNVRELENAVEQACVWGHGPDLLPEHFPCLRGNDPRREALYQAAGSGELALERAVREFERNMILDALKRRAYVQTDAAALLGISRRQLKYRMNALGIGRPVEDDTEYRRRKGSMGIDHTPRDASRLPPA